MSGKKKANKKIREELNKEEFIKSHPEDCFCDDPEYDEGTFIRYTDPVDGFPFWNSKGFKEKVFTCKKCKKEFTEKIAY